MIDLVITGIMLICDSIAAFILICVTVCHKQLRPTPVFVSIGHT